MAMYNVGLIFRGYTGKDLEERRHEDCNLPSDDVRERERNIEQMVYSINIWGIWVERISEFFIPFLQSLHNFEIIPK